MKRFYVVMYAYEGTTNWIVDDVFTSVEEAKAYINEIQPIRMDRVYCCTDVSLHQLLNSYSENRK